MEIFKDKKIVEAKSYYNNTNVALGIQFVKDNSKKWTYKVQKKQGYKFSYRLLYKVFVARRLLHLLQRQGLHVTKLDCD